MKIYKKGICGVDLIDQRTAACYSDQKSTIIFYFLRIFLDLMDVICANSLAVYNMMHPNDFTLADFKTIFTTDLIDSCVQ